MARRTRVSVQITARRERLELRVTPAQKQLIRHAAALQGRSLSNFVAVSAQRAAEIAVRDHTIITLTPHDSKAFADAILNPPAPGNRLQGGVLRYTREVEER